LRVAQPSRSYRQKISGTLLFSLLILISLVGGCNRKSRLAVSPVHGRVMYGGQGVPNATVVFFPSEDANEKAKKMRPYAYVDGQGNFELKTYREGDGAPPGKYRVIILVASAPTGKAPKDKPAGEPESPSARALNIPIAVIQKYGNVETAGIEVTVENGENNLEPFVLTAGTARGPQTASGSAISASSKN
jgi:hypothetical protein